MNKEIAKQLKDFALDVNNVLSDYLVLHNRLIKESCFMSIFRKIDFEKYYNNSSSIAQKLISISNNIEKFDDDIRASVSEKEFITCLLDYISALLKTIQALMKISYSLWQKGLGDKDKHIGWKDHKANWNDYKNLTTEYLKLGDRLNNLYKSIGNP